MVFGAAGEGAIFFVFVVSGKEAKRAKRVLLSHDVA
jgi:hypothetical protein